MPSTEISKQILLARQRKGYSQKDVAKALRISCVHISELENGNSYPSIEIFGELVKLLDIPADVLLQDMHKDFLIFAIDDYLARINSEDAREFLLTAFKVLETNNNDEL